MPTIRARSKRGPMKTGASGPPCTELRLPDDLLILGGAIMARNRGRGEIDSHGIEHLEGERPAYIGQKFWEFRQQS
ncbi:uncharacterized protein DFL_009059 [Arthrobotrys flagrans]|uniref:Uncharacterized protein n=1 Tax=Arthrobotrys flagrans TaxID=97331 RepID=A0A436ZQL0_ARTFL|nr:hypothetical protein DFL_009059 [Arthrobotrys flagrans]